MSPSPDGSGAFVFSVAYIGDTVMATMTFDALLELTPGPLVAVTSPQAAPLLRLDPRLADVREVRSSNPILWRVSVLMHVLEARRRGASVANLEVYPPRWRFLRATCRALGIAEKGLALPDLIRDNDAAGAPTRMPHRSAY